MGNWSGGCVGGRRGPVSALAIAICLAAGALATIDASGAELELAGVATLFRYSKAWDDYAQPLAVLQVGQAATALHWVPAPREDAPPLYLLVGDAGGGLHVLSPSGRLAAQHQTGTASPVTALGSYRLSRNTTVLLTGHRSGELRLHTLVLPLAVKGQLGMSWQEGADDGSDGPRPRLSLLQALAPEAVLCGAPSTTTGDPQQRQQRQQGACLTADAAGCAPIVSLHAAARGGTVAATAVAIDAQGRLAVLKQGGATGLGVRIVRRSGLEETPTALRLSSATAAVLGSTGVASQRLSPPPPPKQPQGAAAQQEREQPPAAGPEAAPFKACTGLNDSTIAAAVFDARHSNRAYALTSDNRLLALVVGGERAAPSGCTVRAAAALPPGMVPPMQQQQQQGWPPVAVAALPGYLLAASSDRLALFNTTAAPRSAPCLLLQQQLSALREQFGLHPAAQPAAAAQGAAPQQAQQAPLVAASRQGQHVAITLNATVLALFHLSLPYRAPLQPNHGALRWMQILQPLGMIGVAAMVLYRARARRSGGGGGRFAGGGFGGDPRLREFERLLQNNTMGGAVATQRHRPGPGAWGSSRGSSGSDVDESPHGRLPPGGGSGAAREPKQRLSLFGGRSRDATGGGSSEPGSSKEAAARSRRAAAMAAEDDREIAALRAELADADIDEPFGSDIDAPLLGGVLGGSGRRGSDELSALRRRFGQTHL